MKRIEINRGGSKGFFILSLINGGFYAVWAIAYIVCTILRASAFSSAQSSMAIGGYSVYTLEVTSPMFAVLRVLVYTLPLVLAVWIGWLALCDKKRHTLPSSALVVGVFGADVISALLCTLDITTLHMIF